jgi:shikimate kinase
MSPNIVLTGLMGAGKSTVGKALAKVLKDYTFIDSDDVIVDIEGMTIPEIFEKKGEPYFREVEKSIISELSEEEDLIIALGGGAFESEDTRKNLENNCITIYLKSSVDRLLNRIKDDKNRQLLQCENPKGKLEELLEKREPNYLKADYIIETGNKNIDEIVEEILEITEEI